jgi:hypothetical protein
MTVSPFDRFAVRSPIAGPGMSAAEGPREARRTFLSGAQVPEANNYVEMGWIREMPTADARRQPERVADYDQFLLHIGMDPATPQVLGGTIEFFLGGQPIVFNTTTSIFIPKGTPHGPITWKEFHRPHVQLAIAFGTGDPSAAPAAGDTPGFGGESPMSVDPAPRKTQEFGFDNEHFVIRSPMREAGPDYVANRQNPTMTYLSRTQIAEVDCYLEFGWIWGVPDPPIPKMRHDDFDEIVFHIGSDPDDPADLGGTLEFGVGDDLLEFDSTHCAYIPREMDHGPLRWKGVRRPLIEMALMVGAGTLDEGWNNSFFDLPDGARRGPK